MNCNVGRIDKIIRFIIGAFIIAIGIVYQSWWGLIGILPVISGITKVCPLYAILRISTIKKTDTAENK